MGSQGGTSATGAERELRGLLAGQGPLTADKAERWRLLVREGLPFALLGAVSELLQVPSLDMARLVALPPRTLARRKKAARLTADESDRLLRVARVASLAARVLGGPEKMALWLHRPNRALGGEPPLQHLDTDLGARQVEEVLGRIAHGVYS